MLTVAAYTRSQLVTLGGVFFSASFGFFQRGSSAMMTFLGLGFGGSGLLLAGSLVIVFSPDFFMRNFLRPNRCHFTRGNLLAATALQGLSP
jgi:hypothetical protein